MKRIGYIIPYLGTIQKSHSLMNSIKLLTRAGYLVDVIRFRHPNGNNNLDVSLSDLFPHGTIRDFSIPLEIESYGMRRVWRWLRFAGAIARRTWGKEYLCFFAVDHAGLIAASLTARLRRIPLIYYSLELWITRDHKQRIPLAHWQKSLEVLSHRQVWFTIVQDEIRAGVLSRENRARPGDMVIVPHSPMGEPYQGKGTYFRDKFNLGPDRKIMLSAGSTNASNLALELARAAQNWPPDWTLVLHGNLSLDGNYVTELLKLADGRRVVISTQQVPYAELPGLVSSADVGLAFYPQDNVNYFVTASGKIADYVKCGLPVVASDLPTLKLLVEKYHCGRCVAAPEAAREAIAQVLADYGAMRENAFRCYREGLEYSRAFQPVLDRLSALG